MCNKMKKIIIIASLCLSVNVSVTRAVTDEKLKEHLNQKYGHILKESELDRQNDPDTYQQRLELMDGLRGGPNYHGGMRVGIYPPPFLRGRGVRWRVGPDPLGPESVPFLLEILIKGPPLQANGMRKDPDPKISLFEFRPQEYDLWARCWAAGRVCEYNHPSILPILVEQLKSTEHPELRYYSVGGIRGLMDPNGIDPLIELISDDNNAFYGSTAIRDSKYGRFLKANYHNGDIDSLAWISLNQMTGRSYLARNRNPNAQDITEFRNWWQNNKNKVIEKFYNKKTGRLEPKFEKTDLEKELAIPLRSPPKRVGNIDVYVSRSTPPGYKGKWIIQYHDPHGNMIKQGPLPLGSQRLYFRLPPLKEGNRELLLSIEQDGLIIPWAYTEEVNVKSTVFPRKADMIVEPDKAVSFTLTCNQIGKLSQLQSIELFYKKDSRLALMTFPLKGDVVENTNIWSHKTSFMPGTYHLFGTKDGQRKSIYLGPLTILSEMNKTYDIAID